MCVSNSEMRGRFEWPSVSPDEQMLQLTFPALFLGGEGVLKTLASSQQHLLAAAKFKPFFFFLWCLTFQLEIMDQG